MPNRKHVRQTPAYTDSAIGFIQTQYHLPKGGYYDDLQEVGLGHVDWTDSAQDRDRWQALVNAVMNLRFS
jgi:hypothetical protein